jgi:hypothetical protein
MLLDVCHDWVGSTNALLHWPHESGVAQNAGDSAAVEESQRMGLLLLLLRSGNAENARRNEERLLGRRGNREAGEEVAKKEWTEVETSNKEW